MSQWCEQVQDNNWPKTSKNSVSNFQWNCLCMAEVGRANVSWLTKREELFSKRRGKVTLTYVCLVNATLHIATVVSLIGHPARHKIAVVESTVWCGCWKREESSTWKSQVPGRVKSSQVPGSQVESQKESLQDTKRAYEKNAFRKRREFTIWKSTQTLESSSFWDEHWKRRHACFPHLLAIQSKTISVDCVVLCNISQNGLKIYTVVIRV